MKRASRRLFASAVGVLLGVALIGPIQAARWVNAVCSYSASGIYEQMKALGPEWTPELIQRIADAQRSVGTCSAGGSVRGFYVDNAGDVEFVTKIGDTYYFLTYAPNGDLQNVQ